MAEASDDEDDAPMPDAPPEPELIDMPPAPGVCTPNVKLGALHRIALGVRRWTTLMSLKKLPSASYHIVPLLSHVSVVPCILVLCVLPRLPDSDEEVSFLFFSRWPQKVLTQGDFCAVP